MAGFKGTPRHKAGQEPSKLVRKESKKQQKHNTLQQEDRLQEKDIAQQEQDKQAKQRPLRPTQEAGFDEFGLPKSKLHKPKQTAQGDKPLAPRRAAGSTRIAGQLPNKSSENSPSLSQSLKQSKAAQKLSSFALRMGDKFVQEEKPKDAVEDLKESHRRTQDSALSSVHSSKLEKEHSQVNQGDKSELKPIAVFKPLSELGLSDASTSDQAGQAAVSESLAAEKAEQSKQASQAAGALEGSEANLANQENLEAQESAADQDSQQEQAGLIIHRSLESQDVNSTDANGAAGKTQTASSQDTNVQAVDGKAADTQAVDSQAADKHSEGDANKNTDEAAKTQDSLKQIQEQAKVHAQKAAEMGRSVLSQVIEAFRVDPALVLAFFKQHGKKIVALIVTIILIMVAVYVPAKNLYIAKRAQERLEMEYLLNLQHNAALRERVENLQTNEGIEDEARKNLGLVMPGETSVKIENASEQPEPREEEFAKRIEKYSGRAQVSWWTRFLDFFFGVEDTSVDPQYQRLQEQKYQSTGSTK